MKALTLNRIKRTNRWWGNLDNGNQYYIKATLHELQVYEFPPKLEGESDDEHRHKGVCLCLINDEEPLWPKIDLDLVLAKAQEHAKIDFSGWMKGQKEKCYQCGGTAYKTDGQSKTLCENLANYGQCKYEGGKGSTPRTVNKPYGRNDLCPCGSGKKYKKCHLGQDFVIPKAKTNGSQPV
jgi:hypothetical protein